MGRISFEILFEFVSTLPVLQLALFRRKLSPSTSQDSGHLRENVDAELSASTADAVLEFSVLTLLHLVTPFCNTVLPSGRFSPTVFSRLQDVSCEDQSLLISTSKLHHFLHTRIRGNHNDLVNNHPLLDHKSD